MPNRGGSDFFSGFLKKYSDRVPGVNKDRPLIYSNKINAKVEFYFLKQVSLRVELDPINVEKWDITTYALQNFWTIEP